MLRLYRSTAEQLLLLAVYTKREVGSNLAQMAERLRSVTMNDYTQQQVLKQARNTRIPDKALDDLIQTLVKGLIVDSQGGGETDLIDRMVSALQTPFTRNVLSGETLSRLRAAILLPSEAGGLTARLSTKEMSCGGCGKPLHDLESVTMSRDARQGQTVLCHRCVAPHTVPCITCEGTAALSTKAMNAMSRMQCPTCLEAKVVVPKKGEGKSPLERLREAEERGPAPRFITSNYRTVGVTATQATPRVTQFIAEDSPIPTVPPGTFTTAMNEDIQRLRETVRRQAAMAEMAELRAAESAYLAANTTISLAGGPDEAQ